MLPHTAAFLSQQHATAPPSILFAVLCLAACVTTDCGCRDKYMKFILEDRKFIILDKNQASHQSGISAVGHNAQRQTAHPARSLLAGSTRSCRLH